MQYSAMLWMRPRKIHYEIVGFSKTSILYTAVPAMPNAADGQVWTILYGLAWSVSITTQIPFLLFPS